MGKQHLSREGRIKRKHIKDVLKDECGVVFGD